MDLNTNQKIEKKLLELKELLTKIEYPGDNERHIFYYIEEAQELLDEILDLQN